MVETNLADIINDFDNLKSSHQDSPQKDDKEINKEINEYTTQPSNIIDDFAKAYPENIMEENTSNNDKQENGNNDTFRPTPIQINTVAFSNWFSKHVDNFEDINELEFNIEGIPEKEMVLLTVPVGNDKLVNNVPQRRLEVIRNADSYMVFDKEPESIFFFTNGLFEITYDLGDNQYIISYAAKSGLLNFYAVKKDDIIIPIFMMPKLKRRDLSFNVYKFNNDILNDDILNKDIDINLLVYHYKQASKIQDEVKTNLDAIKWAISRKNEMIDLNHWIIIDKLIISILGLNQVEEVYNSTSESSE